MPYPPVPGTQEARILDVLYDLENHTSHDWPEDDRVAGRNAVGRLVGRGYPIVRGWVRLRGTKFRTYRLLPPAPQGELQLAA